MCITDNLLDNVLNDISLLFVAFLFNVCLQTFLVILLFNIIPPTFCKQFFKPFNSFQQYFITLTTPHRKYCRTIVTFCMSFKDLDKYFTTITMYVAIGRWSERPACPSFRRFGWRARHAASLRLVWIRTSPNLTVERVSETRRPSRRIWPAHKEWVPSRGKFQGDSNQQRTVFERIQVAFTWSGFGQRGNLPSRLNQPWKNWDRRSFQVGSYGRFDRWSRRGGPRGPIGTGEKIITISHSFSIFDRLLSI
jgi:hypothetical protein